ncbi:Protein of unknown function [Nocardiopsis flavescens]|uniref:DUF1702 family protein n=1 Tax=Nocardiopsis flavescens TaxID=758803 RepID=A0A1M6PP61_9ACTN|nr:DUF1702 family protein [Nocardiopsis flavescens]SHK09628.1 Protein of unknown function [Nocardiopsis flavescens]
MSTSLATLRRRILTPGTEQTLVETRGFHSGDPRARTLIETVGHYFLAGYGHAAQTASPERTGPLLDAAPARFRGFAHEGAAMAFTVLDGLSPRGGLVRAYMAGPGEPHLYMAHVGVGWALARLPRPLWPAVHTLDPLLRWLVLDGYGFHQAYFRTERFVRRRALDGRPSRWSGDPGYAPRAVDQGVGRALWFVACADGDLVADLVDSFPEERRADLYGGVGLAAVYAGGCDRSGLERLCGRAGAHRPRLAQGAAFAAEARLRAGLLVPHVEEAAGVLFGGTAAEAARAARETRPSPAEAGRVPAYEVWRSRLAERWGA